MNTRSLNHYFRHCWLILVFAAWPAIGNAQVAVAEIEEIDEFPIASSAELETLVGPIALYPDDLLAIVLPASTFPLQIVEALRFLEDLEDDPSLKPDDDWDDSIVALLNYPEVVRLLNEDLDWAWRLGEVVVAQQSDVIAAIELFRDRAYAAGNLKSDDYQIVANEESSIQITPVQEDVIYVPYYEPERVVVYQPTPAYFYYPRPYPVYYYPYSAGYSFHDSYFWGVTTAFSIGWHHHHLNVHHHSFYGHPYYGRSYWDRYYWYRRPDIHVYNNVYVRNNDNVSYDRYQNGDRWQANERRTVRYSDQRVTRTRYYPNSNSSSSSSSQPSRNTNSVANRNTSGQVARSSNSHRQVGRQDSQEPKPDIQFRDRGPTAPRTTTSRPSTQTRQPQVRQESPRQTQVRQEPSRQTQVQRSEPRQSQARQTQTRQPQVRQSEPRQSQTRQSQPRQSTPKASQPRQSTPKASQPRQSTPKASQPRQSAPKASSSRPSQAKQSRSSSSSSRSSERASQSSQSRSKTRDH